MSKGLTPVFNGLPYYLIICFCPFLLVVFWSFPLFQHNGNRSQFMQRGAIRLEMHWSKICLRVRTLAAGEYVFLSLELLYHVSLWYLGAEMIITETQIAMIEII